MCSTSPAQNNFVEGMKYTLLILEINLHSEDEDGQNALHYAARGNAIRVMKY